MSDFGDAFAAARGQGLQTFDFRGRKFTTETKEEEDARLGASQPQPQGASQAALHKTAAGQLMGTGAVRGPGHLDLFADGE